MGSCYKLKPLDIMKYDPLIRHEAIGPHKTEFFLLKNIHGSVECTLGQCISLECNTKKFNIPGK